MLQLRNRRQLAKTTDNQPPSNNPKGSKLLVYLAVSFLVFIAALVFFIYRQTVASGNTAKSGIQNSDSSKSYVKIIIPDLANTTYKSTVQNTDTSENTLLSDRNSTCRILTSKISNASQTDVRQVALDNFMAQVRGVANGAAKPAEQIVLQDSNGTDKYTFQSEDIAQGVDTPNVNYSQQITNLGYNTIAGSIISVSTTCSQEQWQSKKPELFALSSKIKLETKDNGSNN